MKTQHWIVFPVLLLFLTSCFPSKAPATQPDNLNIETIVEATYSAIIAQTEAAKPPASPTFTVTVTATETPIPPTSTVTFTPTIVYVLPSATPSPTIPAATFTPAITATPATFECKLVSQSPVNGTSMGSRNDFDWVWTVTNTGQKAWASSDVDYLYIRGSEFHKTAGYDLPKSVAVGESIKLGADMIAPKQPGSYSTTWALRKGSQTFCEVTLTIIVK